MTTEVEVGGPPRRGVLTRNVMHFCRVLRDAGLPIGPGRVLEAIHALRWVDIFSSEEFYWALHAVLVADHRHTELFEEAFRLFWRDPTGMNEILAAMLPSIEAAYEKRKRAKRRVDEALHPKRQRMPARARTPSDDQPIEFDATMTYTARELLRSKDFEQMSADEIDLARRAVAKLQLPIAPVATRRFRSDPHGNRIDVRAMLRASTGAGADTVPLRFRSRRRRPPPLVVLCDVSGSMERYSRMLLHFLHALSGARERVSSFVFGTRLTNITRYLRQRDVDVALDRAGAVVKDWAGGTRIGACLGDFNQRWGRRVLGHGAVVLLITDGLDRDGAIGIAEQTDRLHRSCKRLIWLNPLLRYDGFEPCAAGIRAMLPYVDELRPVHNLNSLEQLSDALSRDVSARTIGRTGPRSSPKLPEKTAATRSQA